MKNNGKKSNHIFTQNIELFQSSVRAHNIFRLIRIILRNQCSYIYPNVQTSVSILALIFYSGIYLLFELAE